jgi:uncharacterized cupin superfamily protein
VEVVKIPIHQSDVAFEVWYEGTERKIRGNPLCDVGGQAKVDVGLMELPPGSNTKPGHWHSKEEEHLYALSGQATLHLGIERFLLRPGSYVCFPAGQAEPHHLVNTSTEPFSYIIIGERINGDEVTYPEGAT